MLIPILRQDTGWWKYNYVKRSIGDVGGGYKKYIKATVCMQLFQLK